MKPSKLFITSLLAAAAMSAVPAYAASLTDATLSIESFTTENITALGTAGWTVSGITISGTDGTFTTTGTEGTPLPSITATDGSSNTLSTNVSTGSAAARYTFSTIVTVDASLFSGTSSGNIIAGSTISNGSVSTSNAIGVGFSSGNIIGTWECNGYNTQTSLDVSNSIVNGKVTIGLVFAGGTGANLYLADGSTINLNGLRSNSNYKAIILSNRAVTYSNLYWFNTALSGADMQAAVVSATSTGTRQASLTWAGGTSGTWDYESDTNWTMPGESGTVSTAFQDWDGVTFATDGAQVELTQSSGSYWLKNLTVSAATSLTGTGTVRVDAANLATNAALTLGDNVVLDLGSISAATTVSNIFGKGTVKVVSSSSDHGATLTLGSDFSGTIEYSGKFNTSNGNGTNNPNAKFALSNGSMWGGGTIRNDIHFLTNYQLGDSQATTIVLNGNLTQEAGTTLTIADANITFGGTATLGDVSQTAGTLNINGETTISSYKGPTSPGGGTNPVTNVGADANLNVAGVFYLRYQGNGTSTLNVDGDMVVGGALNLSRDGNGVVNVRDGGTLVASSIGFGQNWGEDGTYTKSSVVNLASGGTLVAGAMTELYDDNYHINSSSLNLNGGVLGTNAESLTISVDSLPIVLGTGTTSTINTGKYDTATKTFTNTETSISIVNEISGDGALKKAGAGTLTLSGNNTFTGGTVIEAGTVVAGSASALGTTKGVEVKNGATLNLGTNAVTVAGLSGAGTVGLADGTASSTLTVNSATDSTFSGNIGGGYAVAISLVKQGTGTLELSGLNLLYSLVYDSENKSLTRVYQDVSVDAGTLRIVTNTQAMTYAGATTVARGAALEVSVSAGVSVSLTSVSISEGGKLIIDLSNYASATETFALDLITTSALQYNGEDFASDCTSFLGNAVELKGWTQTGWAESLAYDGSKLSLTMTIPEPSMFGLLAGLGALALAGTRRRRKKA